MSLLVGWLLCNFTYSVKAIIFPTKVSQSQLLDKHVQQYFQSQLHVDLSGQSMFGVDTHSTLSLSLYFYTHALLCHAHIWLMSCLWSHVPKDTPHFVITSCTCLFHHYDGFSQVLVSSRRRHMGDNSWLSMSKPGGKTMYA